MTRSDTVPPAGVNFTALPSMFMNTCCRRSSSPSTSGWTSPLNSVTKAMPASSQRCANTVSISRASARKSTFPTVSSSRPFSIMERSSTSLMSASRWLLDSMIFARQSSTFSGCPSFMRASSVMPMMAFIGVRMSWLMRERKSLLALLAATAAR